MSLDSPDLSSSDGPGEQPDSPAASPEPAPVLPPMAILLELTHRCPMRCLYCYNPLELVRRSEELPTEAWQKAMEEAAELGVLQVHFSGGEPLLRDDLEILVETAREQGLYSNLITSGVTGTPKRFRGLAGLGLMHVQLSLQDSIASEADLIGGFEGAYDRKIEVARMVRDAGLALTLNAVIQRRNIERVGEIMDLAVSLGAHRLEIANTQYYGWGLKNRAALMPSRPQLARMVETVEERMERYKGELVVDFVIPDYHARRPKACMGGWGRRFINVAPDGQVLPCHAAQTIPDMVFDRIEDRPLAEIWEQGEAFSRFRGEAWLPEGCRSCEKRGQDFGGCRCQTLALTGDLLAMDPVCEDAPGHAALRNLTDAEAAGGDTSEPGELHYRAFS